MSRKNAEKKGIAPYFSIEMFKAADALILNINSKAGYSKRIMCSFSRVKTD
jgi:hypothetical protein